MHTLRTLPLAKVMDVRAFEDVYFHICHTLLFYPKWWYYFIENGENNTYYYMLYICYVRYHKHNAMDVRYFKHILFRICHTHVLYSK